MNSSFKLQRAETGFIVLVVAYVLGCWALCIYTGHSAQFMPLMYLGTGLQITGTFFSTYILYRLFRALWIMVKRKPKNPGLEIWNDLKTGPLRPEPWLRALPIFIPFVFFFSTFTSMKFLIAEISPFAWDEFFMKTDQFIHFGLDPWQILQPILGYPFATFSIAFFYILWLPVFFAVLYWQLFSSRDQALRMQFFYAFILTWAINGTFLAIFFSSAGPCFYEHVTGDAHYKPLMDYLYAANEHYKIFALATQENLWENYTGNKQMLGGGISAMPSVHVATVFLFALLGRRLNRFWFAILGTFFLLIFVGSVHLGWHYALDGYLAIITTYILWLVSGQIVKLLTNPPSLREGIKGRVHSA